MRIAKDQLNLRVRAFEFNNSLFTPSELQWTLITTTAFVPKDVAI